MQEGANEGGSRKRQRISSPTSTPNHNLRASNTFDNNPNPENSAAMSCSKPKPTGTMVNNASREEEVGILAYVNTTNPGFEGVLKHRYTDFIVNEIKPDGTVVHLTNTQVPTVNNRQEVKGSSSASASKIAQTNGSWDSKPVRAETDVQPEDNSVATKDTEMDVTAELNGEASTEANIDGTEQHGGVVEDIQETKTEAVDSKLEETKDQEKTQVNEENAQDAMIGVEKLHDQVQIEPVKEAPQEIKAEADKAKDQVQIESAKEAPQDTKADTKAEEANDHAQVETIKGDTQALLTKANDSQLEGAKGDAIKEDAAANKTELNESKAEEVKEEPTGSIAEKSPISDDDHRLLTTYFGAKVRDSILALYKKVLERPDGKAASYGAVVSEQIKDRQLRTQIHQNVRRIFNSKFETSSNFDETIKVSVVGKLQRNGRQEDSWRGNRPRGQPRGKLGWSELGGEFLHFTLYKENKDTMEVISFLASQLRIPHKAFSFAGTKDRRGVTAQRVSLLRGDARKLINLNRDLRGSKIGDLKFEKYGLNLGDLRGNEFVITLRDCQFGDDSLDETTKFKTAKQVVGDAIKKMGECGFLNYYGLQRFGSFSTGTHDVGKLILKSDFRGAVLAILSFNPDLLDVDDQTDNATYGRDDIARAIAINLFETRSNNEQALRRMPKKFSAEIAIIRWLCGKRQNDYIGALISIPRGLRQMYVHAYQSFVWNHAASERWSRYGSDVVEGDLVLVDSKDGKRAVDAEMAEVDESGEVIVKPDFDDAAVALEDLFQRARALTKDEALSGKYTIFDVVLPTPGYDIEYPTNEVGDFYKTFMASELGGGLDPTNMRRTQKDFSLSGSYRQLLARAEDPTFEVKLYSDEKEQLVETDLDRFYKDKPRPQPPAPRFPQQNRGQPQQNRFQAQQRGSARQTQIPQDNPWASFKGNLAESDKAISDMHKAQKAAAALEGPKPAPIIEDKFIQTDAKTGERTGLRETIVQGLKPLAATNVPTSTAESKFSAPEDIPLPATPMVEVKVAFPNSVLKRSAAQMTKTDSDGSNAADQVENLTGEKLNTETSLKEPETTDDTVVVDAAPEIAVAEAAPAIPNKVAVIVSFKLGSSQYATMALRELMKSGGVKEYRSGYVGR